MRLALALIAVAALLLATGCGQAPSRRPAVARYVTRVNRIEARLTSPLISVTKIGAAFSRAQGTAGGSLTGFAEQSTMSNAVHRIVGLRGQLASLQTPPPAVHLRSLLLGVIDGQVRMAGELQKLVVFLPRFSAALQPLGADLKRLETVLLQRSAYGTAAVAGVYAQKTAALRRFQSSLQGILRKLRALRPPAVSEPDYKAQVHALSGMSANAGKLATALAGGSQANLLPLLRAFDRSAASAQSVSAHHAHAAAVRAYDRQVARINQLADAADRERLRLANTLQ